MEGGLNEIRLYATDLEINQEIKSLPEVDGEYTVHYNQNEELFIQLSKEVLVPHFPIHHDVRTKRPSEGYRKALLQVVGQVGAAVPQLLRGLSYFFDPGDTLHPAFFQVFKIDGDHYLYLLRLDLIFRTHEAEISAGGTNDITAEYRTRKLFLDATLIPIDEVRVPEAAGALACTIHQTISQTWIGESGRGYLIQGIWMDHELTKFFSKLFVPQGLRFYPYYPFVCRYRTICHSVIDLSPQGRRGHIPNLHRAIDFLEPEMRRIEAALRTTDFSEGLPVFQEMKARVPPYWAKVFERLRVSVYLNERDMKEFLVEA
ncbi:MAG TPA: hypothetical protein VMV68_09620 [Spirochaetia bacterium]|nr:hypothetical protein [Spirochaetia bacterium]